MMTLKRTRLFVIAAFAMLAWVGQADASLTVFNSFSGNVLVSTDGCGSTNATCTLNSLIQAGSTIQAAYLYSSTFSFGLPTDPNGTTLNQGANSVAPTFTPLGINTTACCTLQAWRADVTAFVQANANLGALTTWTVNEGAQTANIDGEALVIVYSNAVVQPSTHTISILDGFSSSAGDTANISFTALPAGFTAHMFIGDGFSFDGSNPLAPSGTGQTSRITVNGTDITTVAGHCDDAQDAGCDNGNLFTMGGSNAGGKDDPFAPFPCNGIGCVASDHEAYDLANVFNVGDTGGTVDTFNASTDDNIFLEVFDISGIVQINQVPEAGTLLLLGAGLVGLAGARRVLKRRS